MLTDLLNVFGRFRKYHSLFLYYTKFVLSYLLKISHRFQEYINNFLVLTQPNKFFYIVYLYFRYDRMRVRVRFTNRLSPGPFVAGTVCRPGPFVAGMVCRRDPLSRVRLSQGPFVSGPLVGVPY